MYKYICQQKKNRCVIHMEISGIFYGCIAPQRSDILSNANS